MGYMPPSRGNRAQTRTGQRFEVVELDQPGAASVLDAVYPRQVTRANFGMQRFVSPAHVSVPRTSRTQRLVLPTATLNRKIVLSTSAQYQTTTRLILYDLAWVHACFKMIFTDSVVRHKLNTHGFP